MEAIDLSIAKKMVDHYSATRKKLIDKTHNINDTQSIWIPIDQFKSFADQLPDHATGVRIHFAAYDHTDLHYPNQTTAILIGTIGDGTEHTDAVEKGSALATTEGGLDPFNKSKACPPFCDSSSTIA
jgi:hypothetical protein